MTETKAFTFKYQISVREEANRIMRKLGMTNETNYITSAIIEKNVREQVKLESNE